MLRFLLLFTPLLFLIQVNSSAQEYTFDVNALGIEDGLEERQVKGYFFDEDGFMWAYTNKHIQAFDSYRFQPFDLPNIPEFRSIRQAGYYKNNKAWILYNNSGKEAIGLCFIDLHTKTIYPKEDFFDEDIVEQLDAIFSKTNLRTNQVKHLGQYDNKLYFSSPTEIYSFDFESPVRLISLNTVDRVLDWNLRINLIDKHNRLWVPLLGKYAIIDLNQKDTEAIELHDYKICGAESIFYEWEGKILMSRSVNIDQNGARIFLSMLDNKDDKILSYNNSNVVGLANNHFYFLEKDSLKVFNLQTKTTTSLHADGDIIPRFHPLSKPQLLSHKDKVIFNNNFGLYFINEKTNPFKHYFNDDMMDNSNSVRGIQVKDHKLYATLEFEGLYAAPLDNPDLYKLINKDLSQKNSPYLGRDLLYDGKDNLWVAHSAMLSKWNINTQEHEFVSPIPKDNNPNSTYGWSLWQDDDHCIWSFYSEYLEIYCSDTNTLTRHQYKDIGGPNDKTNCYEVALDRSDPNNEKLWLATSNGLLVLDTQKMKIVDIYRLQSQAENRQLPTNGVQHIYIDQQNDKWLATDKGLVHISNSNTITVYDKKNGFISDNLYAIYEDDKERLWISTYRGIVRFDKNSKEVYTYLEDDGIGQEEFNRIAHHRSKDGTLYFGGLNGITAFHPKDFTVKESIESTVQIASLEVYDNKKSQLVNKLETYKENAELLIKPSDQYIKLKVALLNYNLANEKLYAWRIPGAIDAWTYQKDRNIQLANLPYGVHQLVVKARDENGQWSDSPLQLKIHVLKPIYLRNWFLAISILLLALGIYTYNRYRLNRLKKEKVLLQTEIAKATAQIQEDKSLIEAQAQELKKLDQLKTRFFANVSHELRTPLSLILGPIKRLKKSNPGNATDQKLLNYIEKNSVQLKKLVDEILDLSKLEHGKLELQEEEVNLYEYLKLHINQFSSLDTIDHAKILMDLPKDEQLMVMLDKPKFEKIVNNYLSNAIKYTPLHGQIVFLAKRQKDNLLIAVKDTGRGIHPDDLPHIFDRFYQAKHNYDKNAGGTGIGLSLTQELAQLMDGKVWVESELGQGSTFYAELPLKIVSRQNIAQSISIENTDTQLKIAKESTENLTSLLIVEDNRELREYYEIILADYHIISTENGQQALDYLQSAEPQPDLILSDLMMPVMNGMELLQKLKSNDLWYQIPVVMLTAKNNRDSKIQALRVGVDDYVTKPFDDEELIVRIKNLLTNARIRKTVNPQEPIASAVDNNLLQRPTSSQEDLEWLESFEAYIIDHISDDLLSIESLAKEFAMSVSTLRRQIKRLTGLTPSKYLTEHRLNAARQMLESRRYNNISTVAQKVGYGNESSFSRAFKSRYGITPSSLLS